MTISRKMQVDPEATPFYHVITRCVRRAWLCGYDGVTKRDFSHRKAWVVDKLRELAEIFLIDVCAYAVMANHVHLVLRIDVDGARDADDEDISRRYGKLFGRGGANDELDDDDSDAEYELDPERIALFRERLSSLSWFMRCLNENIARRANREDNCTGRFWEGRFKSQALLDEAAVLTCMSYVDLNPVRANIAHSLEESDFTSIQQRLAEVNTQDVAVAASEVDQETEVQGAPLKVAPVAPVRVSLVSFEGADDECASEQESAQPLPSTFDNYLALVTYTGQAVREDKRGALPPSHVADFLGSLGIDATRWTETITSYHRHFATMVGHVQYIDTQCARTNRQWAHGARWARLLYRQTA
jgi:putative transposase